MLKPLQKMQDIEMLHWLFIVESKFWERDRFHFIHPFVLISKPWESLKAQTKEENNVELKRKNAEDRT